MLLAEQLKQIPDHRKAKGKKYSLLMGESKKYPKIIQDLLE